MKNFQKWNKILDSEVGVREYFREMLVTNFSISVLDQRINRSIAIDLNITGKDRIEFSIRKGK